MAPARKNRNEAPLRADDRLRARVEALLRDGRAGEAARLAAAGALCAPGSPALASLLEKAASCAPELRERLYAPLLTAPGANPAHLYQLGLLRARAGDEAGRLGAWRRFLAAHGPRDAMQEYTAACTLGDYAAGALAAERALDRPGASSVLSRLWNPWGDRGSAPPGFFDERLAALKRADLPRGLAFYKSFLRAALLFYAGRGRAALRAFGSLPELPAPRYGWMRFPAGWAALYACDYARARREFEAAAACPASRCQALGRLAEVRLCTGDRRGGLLLIARAARQAPLWARGGLRAWEGQLRLFTGDWKGALRCLDRGADLGDDAAYCWRGAARLKLGDLRGALQDLDAAVRLFPADKEARTWRAEALRAAGRPAEALADLEAALAGGPHDWALVNRALVRLDSGDMAGAAADLRRLRPALRRLISALPGAGPGALRIKLEAALRLALGNRRDDAYFDPLWTAGGAEA